MSHSSDRLVYLGLGVPVTLFVIFLLFLGPVGWVGALFIVASTVKLFSWSESPDDRSSPERINCPACGAPNPVERTACSYCDERLS